MNSELVKKTVGSLSKSKVEAVGLNTGSAFDNRLTQPDAGQHLLARVREHPECIAIPAVVLARQGFANDAETNLPAMTISNAFFALPDGEGLMCVESNSQRKTSTFDDVRDALVEACSGLVETTVV